MDPQIRHRLLHEVQRLPWKTSNGYGDKVFDPAIPFMAYKAGKQELVLNREGAQVVSALQLYADGLLPIDRNDEFVVDGVQYPIIAFSHFDGLRKGTGTTVVYL
ncbi:hypothetical protein D3C76_169820 [compost metagenome]